MSDRTLKTAGATPRADDGDAARAARTRRGAWLLAGLAVFVYLGYIARTAAEARV
jgi:hypothetical protein